MTIRTRTIAHPNLLRIAAAAVLVATAPLTTVAPAHAAAEAEPSGLTVDVSDGVDEVSPGDEVTVSATLANEGPEAVDALLVLTAPSYASYTDAEGADLAEADASWTLTVDSGDSATVEATFAVDAIPETEYQVTTLASVYSGDPSGPPLIRAADVDTIPGTRNPADPEAGSAEARASAPASVAVWAASAGTAAIVAAGVLIVALMRRRRGARTP